MAEPFTAEQRAKFACRCRHPKNSYHLAHDYFECLTCKRWRYDVSPDVPDELPLMPYLKRTGVRVSYTLRRKRSRRVADMVDGGMSPAEAIRLFGVSRWTVIKACRDAGMNIADLPVLVSESSSTMRILKALIDDPAKGLSAVASELGVTRQRVHQICRDAVAAGIPGADRVRKIKLRWRTPDAGP